MKLASIQYKGLDRIAVQNPDGDLAILDSDVTMLDLISGGDEYAELIDAALSDGVTVPADDVQWYAPVVRPGKICGVAMNNSASNERKISAPDHPAFFLKPATCLIGHRRAIQIKTYYGSVHPEPELAAIIGRTTRHVDAVDAMPCIFGYTIFNDITGNGMRADDLFHYWALYSDPDNPDQLQRREQHLSYAARYKGTDTFGCMGPFLVTADEISNPDDLAVTCSVGGDIIANDSTRYYNYKVAEVVSYISQFMTLEPGDVISCGTAFKPAPGRKSIHTANFQQVAGPVEVSIESLGSLYNEVELEEREIGQWRLN